MAQHRFSSCKRNNVAAASGKMWKIPKEVFLIATMVLLTLPNTRAGQSLSRQKKALQYTTNSCTGILIAMSLPVGLENRNLFYSFNFEANYNMPTTAPELVPGPLTRLDLVDGRDLTGKATNDTIKKKPSTFPLISRVKLYRLIEQKISGLNLNGRKCLLRLICEATEEKELFNHNGVLGDLMQILLIPSTTTTESESSHIYLKSELAGRNNNCGSYRKECPVNLLDMFTKFF